MKIYLFDMKPQLKQSISLLRRHPVELQKIIELEDLQAKAISFSPDSEKLILVFVERFYSTNKDRAAMGCAGLEIAIKLWGISEDGDAALDRLLKANNDSDFWNTVGNYRMYIPVKMRQLWQISGPIKDMSLGLKKEASYEWVCNECNFPNFTGSIPESEIESEMHSCINCGCFEFHKRPIKK